MSVKTVNKLHKERRDRRILLMHEKFSSSKLSSTFVCKYIADKIGCSPDTVRRVLKREGKL